MNSPATLSAMSAIHHCAITMFENASYIQRELPNVAMRDVLRSQTAEVCGSMVGTKHDVISVLSEIDELIESNADGATVSSRIDRVMRWLSEDISKMHDVVMALREDSQKDESHTSSLVLVQESAANIINAFLPARAAVAAIGGEKS